jgi:hypothetical protein
MGSNLYLNGKIAKDKFCISRWVHLQLSPLRNKVSAAKGTANLGREKEQASQEKQDESSKPRLAEPTKDA